MKQTIGVVVALLAGAGCVPGNGPIRVNGVFAYETEACGLEGDIFIARGSTDLSGSGRWGGVISLTNEEPAREVFDSRGRPLSSVGANNFVSEYLQLKYTSQPALRFADENVPFVGVLPAEADDVRWGVGLGPGGGLIGPKALQTLRDSGREDDTTLLVTFSFVGHYERGGTGQSNPFTFPIIITNRTPTAAPCVSPRFLAPTGPCGGEGGQDGTSVICCTAATDPGCSVATQ